MDDVTELRDALLEAIDEAYCPPSAGGTEGIWCLNHDRPMRRRTGDCEMVAHWREVAAVEARAALTPERLAKALSKVFACGEVSTVDGSVGLDTVASMLLAALATDEAVP